MWSEEPWPVDIGTRIHMSRRRFLIPEVVQTSAMDCGPAALKSLLNGFGVKASYGRLREACQTDVDGTSINTIEDIAQKLGLDAEQVLVPVDHLLTDPMNTPCLIVVELPGGATHFVVLWRVVGNWVQLMDPAIGRRWQRSDAFVEQIYRHTQTVAASDWREWAGSAEFQVALRRRVMDLGIELESANQLMDAALSDTEWNGIARLDAALRLVATLKKSKAVADGTEAPKLVSELAADPGSIPPAFWSVQPSDNEGEVHFRGAVLVRIKGVSPHGRAPDLSPELLAALEEQPDRPLQILWQSVKADSLLPPVVIAATILMAAVSTGWEATIFRTLLEMNRSSPISGDRPRHLTIVITFAIAIALLELPIASALLRMGRRLELMLRKQFARKIPLLNDRYFRSRLSSDMAQRIHTAEQLREVPELAGQLLRTWSELFFTVAALCWFFPECAVSAIIGSAVCCALPLIGQRLMREPDLRWRNQNAALNRFYFDGLLGLIAIRAHGAQRVIRREQSNQLLAWAKTGFELQNLVVLVEGLQAFCGFLLCIILLRTQLMVPSQSPSYGGLLLLIYWALRIPALSRETANITWRYPSLRNTLLRLLEPLTAPEEPRDMIAARKERPLKDGMEIDLDNVSVVAAGHAILNGIRLHINPGEHVAVIGPSGAGKSSLVGLLLGWHRPVSGAVRVDGQPLTASRLDQLRSESVWVDPQVQIWNATLLENLRYGAEETADERMAQSTENARIGGVLNRLPNGFQTQLGEGGGLVSGGEGQRVRMGRAMGKDPVRLAILDEPARGLESTARKELVSNARNSWRTSTLICITHDIASTRTFDRVIVMEAGSIVEDGCPEALYLDPRSRYRALLNEEESVRADLWFSSGWRRWRIEDGRVVDQTVKPGQGS